MTLGASEIIAVTTSLLRPVIGDIYKSTKGGLKKAFENWNGIYFPQKISEKIHSLENIKTLWSRDTEVSILNFYYPSNISIGFGRRSKPARSLSDIGDGNIVIQGIVGQGKSVLLRYLALQEARNEQNPRIPIFLELRTLSSSLNLRTAIYKHLESYDINIEDTAFDHIAKSGKFVLFLDGFDELDEKLVKDTINDLVLLAKKYHEMQIVISSRPGGEIQKVNGFKVARIAPLRDKDYAPFLEKLGLNRTRIFDITEAIKNSPNKISGLITTPLMLTLVVIVYESEKEIPSNLPDFFERLFQTVFTRHDRLKAAFERKHHSGLSERKLQSLFEAFCFMTIRSGFGRSLSFEQFGEAFKLAQEYSDKCECKEENFKADIIKVACLMLEEGIDTTTFLHKSVLEYYAAAYIKHCTEGVAEFFYEEAVDNFKTWREVLIFLSNIDPYRFSKHYAPREIDAIENEFIVPLKKMDDRVLLEKLLDVQPSFCTSYDSLKESSRKIYSPSMYGPIEPPPRLYYGLLDSLLVDAAKEQTPDTIEESEMKEIIKDQQKDINHKPSMGYQASLFDEQEINLRQIFKLYGAEHFWTAIEIFKIRLDNARKEAAAVVKAHEKPQKLFPGKTK